MDCFLKCYLDEFGKLPRNTLFDRRKRKAVVEYINTMIEGCRRGEECDSKKTVQEAVIALIRYHEENLQSNNSVCKMGKYHNILYVAMKICYDWQLQDTATIVTLLEHMYLCEKTFERIYVGALFGTKAPHYIAGWKSDFENQEENLRAMVYFIDHATNGGLDFPSEKSDSSLVRFIDVPIESCGRASPLKIVVQLGLPDKVHILLRYGALISDQFSDHEDKVNLVEHLLRRLMEFNHVYPYNIVACLQLILRCIPSIEFEPDYGSATLREHIFDSYQDLVQDAILPLTRCGVEVPELKHLCRCSIRKRLWGNYQLPNGIRQLPIPDTLRRYVDIMED